MRHENAVADGAVETLYDKITSLANALVSDLKDADQSLHLDTENLSQELTAGIEAVLKLLIQGKKVSIQEDKDVVSTVEAASILGVSRPYVVGLIDKGELQAFNVGRYRRIQRAEVIRFQRMKMEQSRRALVDLVRFEEESCFGREGLVGVDPQEGNDADA